MIRTLITMIFMFLILTKIGRFLLFILVAGGLFFVFGSEYFAHE